MRFLAFPRLTHNIWLPLEERACSSEWAWVRASPGSISCAFVLAAIYETTANTNWDSVIFCLRSLNWSWPIMPHHVPELNCTILPRCFVVMSSWIDGYKKKQRSEGQRASMKPDDSSLAQAELRIEYDGLAAANEAQWPEIVCTRYKISSLFCLEAIRKELAATRSRPSPLIFIRLCALHHNCHGRRPE